MEPALSQLAKLTAAETHRLDRAIVAIRLVPAQPNDLAAGLGSRPRKNARPGDPGRALAKLLVTAS
ncbi:hypothetical protein ACF1GT_00385 [Streptomyces sp. NPDC014636]|uniref:hypothetical protein n=1 Tax=Streptomyces sp. NPDC014636 TaxID=3364876 RepID=UPI0036FA9F6B